MTRRICGNAENRSIVAECCSLSWEGEGQVEVGSLGRKRSACAFFALLFVALIFSSVTGQARVNVVNLPNRDSVQLTIYNSVDLTLVKETRFLTLRKGMNKLEFSWANTLIDPTSLEIRALTRADQIEVLDVSYPPRVPNTLEWHINSEFVGEAEMEIRYFTSGITWTADYVAEANKSEKMMNLGGRVRVTNNSGEDYENAQVRLVVGVVRLVQGIAGLAADEDLAKLPAKSFNRTANFAVSGGMALDGLASKAEEKPREIVKEGLSEYFLYTIEGRDTIPNQWSKQLPSFQATNVPIVSYYKYEKERYGNRVVRFYRFKNDKPSHLGNEPLPDGAVKALRVVSADKAYSYVGSTAVKYIPVNEVVELELGEDREVMVRPVLMDAQKSNIRFNNEGDVGGWTTKQTWEIEVQNSKDIDVEVDVRRNFDGDWKIDTSAAHEKVDANKVKFVVPLKPHEKRKWTYVVTQNFGMNVTR